MKVKKVLYVEMTEEAAKDLGLDPTDLVRHKHDETIKLMPIEVDDENIADEIHKDQNRLAKQRERETRCWDSVLSRGWKPEIWKATMWRQKKRR